MKINYLENNGLNFITLDNGTLKLVLCDLGASIFSIYFDNKLMTMSNEKIDDFKSPDIYNGKTIGRTANRIKGNTFSIDGQKFALENNENDNTLHGGKNGLSNKIFTYKVVKNKILTKLIFSYLSKDGESGFPGELEVKVIYSIFENSSKFKINFEAKTTKPTLCNLTNHTFFTLGEESIDNLSLKINASKYIKSGVNDLIPLCIENVTKEIDFRKTKLLSLLIDKLRYGKQNGYDHCFICDKAPKIGLKSNDYLLKINSNFNCCQIYTDNWPNDSVKWLNLSGGTNRSIAIEPQDNILNREVLRPLEKYSRFIKYEIKRIKNC